jgi:hypothetical protein
MLVHMARRSLYLYLMRFVIANANIVYHFVVIRQTAGQSMVRLLDLDSERSFFQVPCCLVVSRQDSRRTLINHEQTMTTKKCLNLDF